MSTSTEAITPIYYDTDLGIDDAMALAYLLASPKVDLVGIGTVSGNCSAAAAARNTLDFLGVAGRADIPVAVGAHDPMVGAFDGGSPEVHGDNGIGDIELPAASAEAVAGDAADMVIELAHTHPGRLTVLAVGPFTNLAIALEREPELPQLVADVVVMGGAACAPGNVTPVAEANIWHDPEAADAVFTAPWTVTMVGLDVTMAHRFSLDDQQALTQSGRPAAQAISAMLDTYMSFYTPIFGEPCVALHDPLAAAIAAGDIDTVCAPTVGIRVDVTDGPGRGQTICDMRGRYRGYPAPEGARHRVVLEIAEPFAPRLREAILSV